MPAFAPWAPSAVAEEETFPVSVKLYGGGGISCSFNGWTWDWVGVVVPACDKDIVCGTAQYPGGCEG